MRNQQQMMDLIMQFAEQDERVRVVAMNGSRVNTKVPVDIFQDYDIVYLVTDVQSFIEDCDWTDYFGEKIIIQMPDAMGDSLEDNDGRFAYLMLLADGNRIDLRLFPLSLQATYIHEDKLIDVLLDKDQRMPELCHRQMRIIILHRQQHNSMRIVVMNFGGYPRMPLKGYGDRK